MAKSDLWGTERPEFIERVAALAGGTTYRVPTGGRGTKSDQMPDVHAVAAALAYGRANPTDIGPDVAFCWVLRSDAYRDRVIARMLASMPKGRATDASADSDLALAMRAAWDVMIWDRPTKRPSSIPEKAWDVVLLFGIKVLVDSAWDALAAAERAYKGKRVA